MNFRREWKNYLTIMLGAAILAFGIYNVHRQAGITEGGVLGMTLLLDRWFGISPAVGELVMDIICYAVGYKVLGGAFARYSLVATCSFALSYGVYEMFPPLLPDLSAHPLVAAVLGAVFVGVGVGLAVRVGGACGGDDALAMVLAKKLRWPISRCYLSTDLAVLLLSLSYIPLGRIAYSLITVTISSFLIGKVQTVGKKEPAAAECDQLL
ncbi:YitT family protein [Neobittarella massiliensis]|uniref:YitT family protein n=1 Tax=Neobittarella massiliensis (ex Bilen et al. 2018) TaxID=2041842 RepID=UPI000CF6B9C9|nr:YitT family protein [Neobittarella massiliensis]